MAKGSVQRGLVFYQSLAMFVALGFLAACEIGINPESDKLTWTESFFSLPAQFQIHPPCENETMNWAPTRKRCFSALEGKGKIPAVIFLHGCAGLGGNSFGAMDLIRKAGYVVFAPNSFGRPGRTRSCEDSYSVMDYRFAEIQQALLELKKFSWVDRSRLVLAGFSEGGIAAAEYRGNEFKVRLIFGWGCSNGIAASSNVPILNLVGERDDIISTGTDLCSVLGRPNSLARHVNSGHVIADDPSSGDIVRKFMQTALN